jgi:tRNA-splicing ligase RtcB
MGYGMPIGGVLATEGVVIPNAVGVDIGCGMCAVKTNLHSDCGSEKLKQALGLIRQAVPTGFKKHKEPKHQDLMPETSPFNYVVMNELDNAKISLGTLGGGNHFIELQTDGKYIWIMIHSGSRNLGLKVAKHYNDLAKKLNARWYSSVPAEDGLAFLPLMDIEAVNYLDEMQYCIDFALVNRQAMMTDVIECLDEVFGMFFFEPAINIAHNYASQERHYGKNVVVHRKGATLATEGLVGIIPGSQGTSSYIVKGLGNRESFMSCSHGAGRRMGRKQAQRELKLNNERTALNSRGILHSVNNVKDLDEAPGAYKDIEEVMANQADLVEIVTKLTPLAVVKG